MKYISLTLNNLVFKRAFHSRKNIEMLYNREVHVANFKLVSTFFYLNINLLDTDLKKKKKKSIRFLEY